jgi:hypothetical protein
VLCVRAALRFAEQLSQRQQSLGRPRVLVAVLGQRLVQRLLCLQKVPPRQQRLAAANHLTNCDQTKWNKLTARGQKSDTSAREASPLPRTVSTSPSSGASARASPLAFRNCSTTAYLRGETTKRCANTVRDLSAHGPLARLLPPPGLERQQPLHCQNHGRVPRLARALGLQRAAQLRRLVQQLVRRRALPGRRRR